MLISAHADKLKSLEESYADDFIEKPFNINALIDTINLHIYQGCDRQLQLESKGKIENVVKYVKQNFLYNRCFCDIATLNEEVLQWLSRTANKLPHGTTKISPEIAWINEQLYLAAFPTFIQTANQQVYTVLKEWSFKVLLIHDTHDPQGSTVFLQPADDKNHYG